jgi:copper chaperone
MQHNINVDNIKCGGCANSIKTALQTVTGVDTVEVDIEQGAVSIMTTDSVQRDHLIEILRTKGYPEQGSVEGIDALGAKAKSFVSCAVGRMSE